VHTVLAAFSVALLATSVLLDVVGLASRQPAWGAVAQGDLEAGLSAGAAAAVFAVAAVAAALPGTRLRRTMALRAAAHIGALALFGGALVMRRADGMIAPSTAVLVLSLGGLVLGGLSAWLTAELAGRLSG
jgi:uncharacterized membrane protein